MKTISDLTNQQLSEFLQIYADRQVDKMSRKELEQIVYDSLVENLSFMGNADLIEYFQSVLSGDEIDKLLTEVA